MLVRTTGAAAMQRALAAAAPRLAAMANNASATPALSLVQRLLGRTGAQQGAPNQQGSRPAEGIPPGEESSSCGLAASAEAPEAVTFLADIRRCSMSSVESDICMEELRPQQQLDVPQAVQHLATQRVQHLSSNYTMAGMDIRQQMCSDATLLCGQQSQSSASAAAPGSVSGSGLRPKPGPESEPEPGPGPEPEPEPPEPEPEPTIGANANWDASVGAALNPIMDRGDPGFWRGRHSAEPLTASGDEVMVARFLVPLTQLDAVLQAGARCIHPSIRTILGDDTADATGFETDIAVAEASTRGGHFAGLKVVAASYRWEGVSKRRVQCQRGVRDIYMPSNNLWFVQYLVQHQVLGWLDYLAHDFSDPDVLPLVIQQMGKIYSAFTVVPQYLLDPRKTVAAMKRGWIFQESAFTAIDDDVMHQYVDSMQCVGNWLFGDESDDNDSDDGDDDGHDDSGDSMASVEVQVARDDASDESCDDDCILQRAATMAPLEVTVARARDEANQRSSSNSSCSSTNAPQSSNDPDWLSNIAEVADALEGLLVLYERRCGLLLGMHKQAMMSCVASIREGKPARECTAWPLDRTAFNKLYMQRLRQASRPRPFRVAATTKFDSVVSSVLDAFGTLEFTQEEDCIVGALAQIAEQHFGQTLERADVSAACGLLKFLWEQQMDVRGFHILGGVQRTMPGLRLCGLGQLHLQRYCSTTEATRQIEDNTDLSPPIAVMRVIVAERQLDIFASEHDGVFVGFGENVLSMPTAAQQLFGKQAALGIHIMVVGDPRESSLAVRHLAVRKKDGEKEQLGNDSIGDSLVLGECTAAAADGSTHAFS